MATRGCTVAPGPVPASGLGRPERIAPTSSSAAADSLGDDGIRAKDIILGPGRTNPEVLDTRARRGPCLRHPAFWCLDQRALFDCRGLPGLLPSAGERGSNVEARSRCGHNPRGDPGVSAGSRYHLLGQHQWPTSDRRVVRSNAPLLISYPHLPRTIPPVVATPWLRRKLALGRDESWASSFGFPRGPQGQQSGQGRGPAPSPT